MRNRKSLWIYSWIYLLMWNKQRIGVWFCACCLNSCHAGNPLSNLWIEGADIADGSGEVLVPRKCENANLNVTSPFQGHQWSAAIANARTRMISIMADGAKHVANHTWERFHACLIRQYTHGGPLICDE